ncbi:MAG: hypothetical protein LBE61_11695 [Burkholderiaceae bacterium]|jgi:hypothetical protein|nr:hypothetical protein [Burkholderiaceae bacterium]
MRSALIELTALAQPFSRAAHWLAQRAGNDSVVETRTDIDLSELRLLVRPRLGKVRRLATSASNSDRMAAMPVQASLQLAIHNPVLAMSDSAQQLPSRPALRVVVKPDASGTGRMVISGRMADVCAELDRLARQERLGRHMQPCA